MAQNKYLDDLGIHKKDYGTNFVEDAEEYQKQRKLYGFDSRECWALNITFVEWLYSHLMRYKEDAFSVVDLEYHAFEFCGKSYTQLEAINYIIEKCKEFILLDKTKTESNPCKTGTSEYYNYMIDKENEAYENMKKAINLFAEIFPAMWW